MGVLGKRKTPEPSISDSCASDIFRQHFESRFLPLEVSKPKDEPEDDEEEQESESEWGGLSGDEAPHMGQEVDALEVVDHSSSQTPNLGAMSKRELRAFMSARPPDQAARRDDPSTDATPTTSLSPSTLPEDAPSLLAQDLQLRRLLAESHLLAPASLCSAAAEPKAFASGRTRQKATDLRIQALGSKVSLLKQEKMPMNMRKGIVAAVAAREAKRRREARENGVILEREVGKKRKRERGRDRSVNDPGVGKFKGAELRLSERDVRRIEGGRDVFGRREKRRLGQGAGRG